MKSGFFKKLAAFVVVVAIVAGTATAVVKRQDILDWAILRGYSAPADVQALATDTTMTEYGRKLFYVNRPQILSDKAEFSNACQQTEQSIVLGCFSNGKGIYLFKVSDPRLDGVMEVTAAHEMLHAAYDRLSPEQRSQVDAMTAKTFESIKSDRIKESIAGYRKRDPGVVPNELHSILGTEVRNLPAELEAYYKQYFSDRKEIVAFSEHYEQEFSSRQGKVAVMDSELAELKSTIESEQAQLDATAAGLKTERALLDNLRGNPESYNRAASAYNKEVANYNVQARQLQNDIERYNKLVKERNALAVEVQNLVEAIDSRPEEL